ncbi:hypothetical protein GF407_02495 [candidate division KSB1 bacterium]|nr:hypothetical protein [candidate division KSB1 bacterium]
MKLKELVEIVGELPVFETGLLLAGSERPEHVIRQLSRWVAGGQVIQLRRGLYMLAPPLRKINPHPFVIANHLEPGSYVSCESVLAYRGLIPEYVPVTKSVGPVRSRRRKTLAGMFEFHHLKSACVFGYQKEEIAHGQSAFVATSEKALVDLIYLTPASDDKAFIRELRLSPDEPLDNERLFEYAEQCKSPKLLRAVKIIKQVVFEKKGEYREI